MAPVGACLWRAGAQGVKGTCGPGIRRALGAAHSIPTSPSPPLPLRPPLSRSAYLPTPRLRVPLLLSRCLPSSSPRVASARSNSTSSGRGVFELAFFPRAAFAFREFRRVRRRRRPTSTEFSSSRFERSRFPVRSPFVIILSH